MRLFVSVDLEGLAEEVAAVQALFEDAGGLRFTDPTQAHVTLKFLGHTDADRLEDLTAAVSTAVEESGVAPFEAAFGGLGVFPSREYISVVWLGVREGGPAFGRLHEAVEDRTVALGYSPESHEFTPHVTLARMEHAGGKDLVQRVLDERDPDVGRMTVSEVRLTESVRTDGGPDYRTVERFGL